MAKHFLDGTELSSKELNKLLNRAKQYKKGTFSLLPLLSSHTTVALIFQKPSTRTRVSFETGVFQLGAHPLILGPDELQLSRGESIKDTALVLSRHVSAIGLRTGPHSDLVELAENSTVPVINMLTEDHHPCQALADLLTLQETFGELEGLKLAYVGDGNNVVRSLAILCKTAGVELAVASPNGYQLEVTDGVEQTEDPYAAVKDAHAIYTDVWVSMGDEDSAEQRKRDLAAYQINDKLLDAAAPNAVAMHCLPAHPGEEITESVLYGDRQRIWDQAENRRYAQMALLNYLIG